MRHYITLLVILFLWLAPIEGSAQENGYWTFSAGLNAVDFNVPNTYTNPYESSNFAIDFGGETFFKDLFQRYDMNWNWSAYFFEVRRYTSNNFSLNSRISLNKITEIAPPRVFNENINYNYFNADLGVNYSLFEKGPFEPYIGIGTGITRINGQNQSHLNFTGGINLWLNENIGLVVNTLFKNNTNNNFYNYFQHDIGLIIKSKKKDQDNDGVPDIEDQCPEIPGKAELNGCPDTDNDGVTDAEDKCPTVAGTKKLNGCPDTDGDGIADPEDKCPTKPGNKSAQGCPDADKDGIQDEKDQCPYKPGPESNSGCPQTDSDNDGVFDNLDNCPNEAGSAENSGCPEFGAADAATMKSFTNGLNFIVDTLKLYPESQELLVQIAAKIKTYTSTIFVIDAHTDSRGTYEENQKLSDRRADAIVKELIKLGVPAQNLIAKGMGERYPIATNMYMDGRRKNRRVEIKPFKD